MNPTSQLESGISWSLIMGLKTGVKLGKSYFNWFERPLFIDWYHTILSNPSIVRCYPLWIILNACLNKI